MIEKNISGRSIARQLGRDGSTLWHVASGRDKTPHIRQAICDALDFPYSIWEEADKKVA